MMKVRIGIDGIGVVGGFGTGVSSFRAALGGRLSAPTMMPGRKGDGPSDLPVFLADTSRLERYISQKELRRISHHSRLALLGAHLAFEDAGALPKDLGRLGIVIATGYGPSQSTFKFLDSVFDDGVECASPTHFAGSVHISAAAHIAMKLGICGPDHTVSQFEMSVPSALLTACLWLTEDRLDAVLLGGVDEYCGVLGYCRRRFFGAVGREGMQALDLERQTAVAGEGAAFLLMSRAMGPGARYAVMDEVEVGRRPGGIAELVPPRAVMLLGADGCKKFGWKYLRDAEEGQEVVCYSSLYGSLPVGFGFQLAAAALMVTEGKIFAAPKPLPTHGLLSVVEKDRDLDGRPVCCLKRGAGGNLAVVILSGNEVF